jgi:hypothetical protein
MVALLTAEGMTRPQFTGATILTSQANAAGGSADEDNAQSASASAQGGGTASSAQGGGGAADGDADAAIMEMVHDLADPHRDIQKSVNRHRDRVLHVGGGNADALAQGTEPGYPAIL